MSVRYASWSTDWWGLGMLTYEMLTGFPPWYCRDRKKLIRRLKYSPLKIPSSFSPAVASFVEELLVRSPSKRLGKGAGGGRPIAEGLSAQRGSSSTCVCRHHASASGIGAMVRCLRLLVCPW